MKVLYLSEWYPHRYDSMSGLFVRKHAESVCRQGINTCVLYLYPDSGISAVETVDQSTNGVREIYIYYPAKQGMVSFLQAMHIGWTYTRRHWGTPDLCQLNVLTKNGLLPLYLRLVRHIPYLLVEHWSGYLPENYSIRGGWHLWLMKRIAAHAACILPVSQRLEDAMKACGISNAKWMRIHNVVDDFFYQTHSRQARKEKALLHVSCFDEKAKNTQGILRVLARLKAMRTDWEMTMVGDGIDWQMAVDYACELGLSDRVRFVGVQTPAEVAERMRQSDLFVFFSHYENAPVVLSECMAMGLPILTSKAGGIPEMMSAECGRMVPPADEDALLRQLDDMLDHPEDYPADEIRKNGEKYSYQQVGAQLAGLYRSLVAANQ